MPVPSACTTAAACIQVLFLTYAFGGSSKYSGKDLFTAHGHLLRDSGLSLVHFNLVATHLLDTLAELGIKKDLVSHGLHGLEGCLVPGAA